MFKKLLSISALAVMLTSSLSAVEVNAQSTITPEQRAVIESFEHSKLSQENILEERTTLPKATYRTRWYFERGSALAWSKDYLEWTYNGSYVSNPDAWQECGFIFPNIVRTKGISQTGLSSSSKYEYKATKTIGAGVVSPWGDVTVYETDHTDYITGDKNGNFSSY